MAGGGEKMEADKDEGIGERGKEESRRRKWRVLRV